MVRFVGLDVHKRVVQAVILDASGKLLCQKRFDVDRLTVDGHVVGGAIQSSEK